MHIEPQANFCGDDIFQIGMHIKYLLKKIFIHNKRKNISYNPILRNSKIINPMSIRIVKPHDHTKVDSSFQLEWNINRYHIDRKSTVRIMMDGRMINYCDNVNNKSMTVHSDEGKHTLTVALYDYRQQKIQEHSITIKSANSGKKNKLVASKKGQFYSKCGDCSSSSSTCSSS